MNEKVKVLSEKLALKEKQISDKKANVQTNKETISALKKEVATIKKQLEFARLEELAALMSARGVTLDNIKSAIHSGVIKPEAIETVTKTVTVINDDNDNGKE